MRVAVPLGVAAAAVQVIGLLRWPLLVPGLASRAAEESTRAQAESTFETLNQILGTVLGETFGYVLTAAWTVLVVRALGRAFGGRWFGGRWFGIVGIASAALIATGVLVPLGIDAAGVTNFVGYVLWTGWLIAFAVRLLLRPSAE